MMKIIISLMAGIFVLAGGWLGIYVWHWEHRPHVLEIYCFALDKSGASPGNLAVFIRTPDNHTVLIDGGKSDSVLQALGSAMPFYRRTIDTIISSSPDDSHVTGLVDVIKRYRIGQVVDFISDVQVASSAHAAFEDEIAAQKIRHTEVSAGDSIDFDDLSLSTRVLFPASSTDFAFSKTNGPVLVFELQFGSTTLVFGGDMTKKEQVYLSEMISPSSSTLLILPHGENVGVADEDFFTTLNPQTVVVLKKPNTPKASTKLAAITAASSKSKKPAKPPFSIMAIPGLSIVNLASQGDMEFISDGVFFIQRGYSQ